MSSERDNVRALFSVLAIGSRMGESGWEKRLRAELVRDGRSYSAISQAAGLGRNFISQMLKNHKAPSIDNFAAICRTLQVSTIYVWTGAPVTLETENLLERWTELEPDHQAAVLALMAALRKNLSDK